MTWALLVFGAVLLLAVLLSERADRTVLSLAALFLLAGFLAGGGGAGVVRLQAGDPLVWGSAETALLVILFTDGMRVRVETLRRHWHLPARALLIGLPLTVLGTALLAHWLARFPWRESLLLAAALGPTDPVFAAAIVGRREIAAALRRMLNVESGLNDGLALPAVLILLGTFSPQPDAATVLAEVLLGIALGVVVPWAVHLLARVPAFAIQRAYETLGGVAVALIVFATAELTGGNVFLAAFAAGITAASLAQELSERIRAAGEILGTLAKFMAVFLFGALLSPRWWAGLDAGEWLFVALALVLVRPVALLLALAGAGLPWREWLVAGWFGPKGFASVVYAVLILRAGVPDGERLFHIAALVIAVSILAHSSSDVPLARWLARTSRASTSG